MSKQTWETIKITSKLDGYVHTLENGLLCCLIPVAGFTEKYAQFTTRYGSVDRTFTIPGKDETFTAPDGVAHFLEHKMFDQEDGSDVMLEFSKLGANSNAYTSNTETSYIFNSEKNFAAGVELLLDYVQEPFFTEASVEKEKGIIEQEIEMYNDQYDYVGYSLALSHSYPHHPLGIDIAGTVESIYAISKDDLYTCYEAFYHPSNMQLTLTGDFDLEAMQTLIEENQAKKGYVMQAEIDKVEVFDESKPATKAMRKTIDASTNYVTALLKDVNRDSGNYEREEMLGDIILDMLFSDISPYYEKFQQEHIVDTVPQYYANYESSYGFLLTQVKAKDPNLFIETYKQCWFEGITITPEQFERVRRSIMGLLLQSESNLSYINRTIASDLHKRSTPYSQIEELRSITFDEVKRKYHELVAQMDDYLSFVLLEGKNAE